MAGRYRETLVTARRLGLATVLALTMVLGSGVAAIGQVIYSDGLASGWQSWSWNGSVNVWGWPPFGGSNSIAWQMYGGWGGLYLHSGTAGPTAGDTQLQFALLASGWGQFLTVSVVGESGQRIGWAQRLSDVGGDPTPGAWKTYSIPLSSLGAAGQRITGVILQDATGGWQPA